MHLIRARNVHRALPAGLALLESCGIPVASRAGECVEAPGPVVTTFERPAERVIFWLERDGNPFFHCLEALWMLAGRRDLAYVKRLNARMADYSDDGRTIRGSAYGYRWRKHFRLDQIESVIALLKAQPFTRRAVLQMYDPRVDLFEDESTTRDVPCNVAIFLKRRAGYLNMTVSCRSNDLIWGLTGSNAVHFSMLLEYLAAHVGSEVGTLNILSNSFHAYTSVMLPLRPLVFRTEEVCPYERDEVKPLPLVTVSPRRWDLELKLFMEDPYATGFEDPFFAQVAKPMYAAHAAWAAREDSDRYAKALEIAAQIGASDWRRAATEWLTRRFTLYQERGKVGADLGERP